MKPIDKHGKDDVVEVNKENARKDVEETAMGIYLTHFYMDGIPAPPSVEVGEPGDVDDSGFVTCGQIHRNTKVEEEEENEKALLITNLFTNGSFIGCPFCDGYTVPGSELSEHETECLKTIYDRLVEWFRSDDCKSSESFVNLKLSKGMIDWERRSFKVQEYEDKSVGMFVHRISSDYAWGADKSNEIVNQCLDEFCIWDYKMGMVGNELIIRPTSEDIDMSDIEFNEFRSEGEFVKHMREKHSDLNVWEYCDVKSEGLQEEILAVPVVVEPEVRKIGLKFSQDNDDRSSRKNAVDKSMGEYAAIKESLGNMEQKDLFLDSIMVPTKCPLCENDCGSSDDSQCDKNREALNKVYEGIKDFKNLDMYWNINKTELTVSFKGLEGCRRLEYDDMKAAYKTITPTYYQSWDERLITHDVELQKTPTGFIVGLPQELLPARSWSMGEYIQHIQDEHGIVIDEQEKEIVDSPDQVDFVKE